MNSPEGNWLPGPTPPTEGWSRKTFLAVLAFVFAFHVALIILFGTKKPILPVPVTQVPHLQLANAADEFIALNDPTLFARPNAHELVTAFWRHTEPVPPPNFRWTESPLYLTNAPNDPGAAFHAGAAFHEFVQDSRSAVLPLNLKPAPQPIAPRLSLENTAMPQATAMEISGDLAQRQLLNPIPWPSWPRNDVIAPSKVQVLADATGNVFSEVLLRSGPDSSVDKDADQLALQLARRLRFAPGPGLTFGEITFLWHTVPTNAVPAQAP
jgi:hypothetical protein